MYTRFLCKCYIYIQRESSVYHFVVQGISINSNIVISFMYAKGISFFDSVNIRLYNMVKLLRQ